MLVHSMVHRQGKVPARALLLLKRYLRYLAGQTPRKIEKGKVSRGTFQKTIPHLQGIEGYAQKQVGKVALPSPPSKNPQRHTYLCHSKQPPAAQQRWAATQPGVSKLTPTNRKAPTQ